MAHCKSAVKRLRTSTEANLRNRSRISEIKTVEKKFRAAVAGNDNAAAASALKEVVSCLDKAAKVGTIHSNKAANKKSQLDKLFQTLAK
ncbi:MAG: 30S ribosomal protein S20 [Victivallaceae bacterium]|nr:30S ribosomal protein S20 [Victivallaceae bacterium]